MKFKLLFSLVLLCYSVYAQQKVSFGEFEKFIQNKITFN